MVAKCEEVGHVMKKVEGIENYTLYQSEWPSKTNQQTASVRMWREGNPTTLLVGIRLVQPLWKVVCNFLRKLKVPFDPAIPLLGIIP